MNWIFWIFPLISAIIGWAFASLLVQSIFRPIIPVYLGPFKLHGFLPARQQSIGIEVAKIVAAELKNDQSFPLTFANPANLQKIMPGVERHIDEFLRVRLVQEMPMIGMFIGEKTIDSLKALFIKELTVLFPQVMSEYWSKLGTDSTIEEFVGEKFVSLSSLRIEAMVRPAISVRICRAGTILGFLIGLAQLFLSILVAK